MAERMLDKTSDVDLERMVHTCGAQLDQLEALCTTRRDGSAVGDGSAD